MITAKVKQSLCRPRQALGVSGGRGSHICRQHAHESGKVISTRRLYPPENIPGVHFYSRLSLPHGHSAARKIMSIKNYGESNPRPSGL